MFNRAEAEALDQQIRRIMAKVNTERPVTVEDVHLTAATWALLEQPNEAAAGATTGADLALLAVVRGQQGAGDAAAQTVFDAACQWRDSTRLDGPYTPGPIRRTLALAVDRPRRPWWQRHMGVLAALTGSWMTVGPAGDMLLLAGGVDWWPAHVAAVVTGTTGLAAAWWLTVQSRRLDQR